MLKATSNICTNSGLCALAFSIHLALLGEAGFTRLAAINHAKAVRLAERIDGVRGVTVLTQNFFNEMTLRLAKPAAPVVERLAADGILGGVPVSRFYPGDGSVTDLLIIAATETNTDDDVEAFAVKLEGALR